MGGDARRRGQGAGGEARRAAASAGADPRRTVGHHAAARAAVQEDGGADQPGAADIAQRGAARAGGERGWKQQGAAQLGGEQPARPAPAGKSTRWGRGDAHDGTEERQQVE